MYYVVNNPNADPITSYKLAVPGHTEGTLTSDTPNAVIGNVGSPPALVPVDVTAHDLDTGATLSQGTQVADETDVGTPLGSSLLDIVVPLAVAQAGTQIYNGTPANESGRMCLAVTISFKVRIPAAARGLTMARIDNQQPSPPGGSGNLASSLAVVLTSALTGGQPTPSQPPPDSIAALRRQFAAVAGYDGLLMHLGHRRPQHVYRNVALLITGQANLIFDVTR